MIDFRDGVVYVNAGAGHIPTVGTLAPSDDRVHTLQRGRLVVRCVSRSPCAIVVRPFVPGTPLTLYHIDVMWAIVLFGILLWTTACVVLNAALRRGMGFMGMSLSYGALIWMLFDLPWVDVAATWAFFAVVGGVITLVYEVWARRRYAGTARASRPIIRVTGILLWPAMIPDAVGLMLNDAGIIPADERSETHEEDARRITDEQSVVR